MQIGFTCRTWDGKNNYFEDKCSDTFTAAINLILLFWSKKKMILFPLSSGCYKEKKTLSKD